MQKKHSSRTDIIPLEVIERRIYVIRGHKVILDRDLADLYEVSTKVFNQAVKRNLIRFPKDFMFQLSKEEDESVKLHNVTSMFQLSKEEVDTLRSQIVTSNGRGGRRYLPYAFTQEGLAMLSSVLNSDRAIAVNIAIMRAFVKLREMIVTNKDLAHKIEALERQYSEHDQDIQLIFKAIKKLLEPPPGPPKEPIGFRVPNDSRAGKDHIPDNEDEEFDPSV